METGGLGFDALARFVPGQARRVVGTTRLTLLSARDTFAVLAHKNERGLELPLPDGPILDAVLRMARHSNVVLVFRIEGYAPGTLTTNDVGRLAERADAIGANRPVVVLGAPRLGPIDEEDAPGLAERLEQDAGMGLSGLCVTSSMVLASATSALKESLAPIADLELGLVLDVDRGDPAEALGALRGAALTPVAFAPDRGASALFRIDEMAVPLTVRADSVLRSLRRHAGVSPARVEALAWGALSSLAQKEGVSGSALAIRDALGADPDAM